MNTKQITKFVKNNAPTILAITGTVGVGVTAYLSAKDTRKFDSIKATAKDKKDLIVKGAKAYAPTIISGVTTAVCILGGDAISRKQKAALIAVAATTAQSLASLHTAIDKMPPETQAQIDDEYKKEIKNKAPIDIPEAGEGKDLYYEEHYGYFTATPEQVCHALQELNERLAERDVVYLNEFFELLDIHDTVVEGLEYIGWNVLEIGCNSQYNLVNADITEGTPLDPWCECKQHTIKWNTPAINNPDEWDPQ